MPIPSLARPLLVMATCATACAGVLLAAGPVKSQWLSRDISVDGRLDEWGDLTVVGDDVGVAAANNADSVFVAVSTSNSATRAGMAGGLIVWIAPAGKQTMDAGLQFPTTVDTQPGASNRPLDPSRLNDVDVLGPGKTRRLVTLTPDLGIEAASGTERQTLMFELRLPLMTSTSRARTMSVPAGRAFQLGIFTPESKVDESRDAPPAGSRTYGLGPIVGGPGTGIPLPDSSQKEPREERPRKLKLWTTVQLAAAPR